LPLFVATITTLNRVSNSAEQELNVSFESNARNLRDGILSSVTEFFKGSITREELENVLLDKAKVTNLDITFYDRAGKYVASSQPLMFENQILSPLMDRAVWEKISNDGFTSIIHEERIGSLQFNNCYVTLKSPDSGVLLGALSVPFFDSVSSLEETQVSVLSNFLTVFTIIFILFSILSFYVVDSLTFPLRFITRILSRTTLSGNNQPLEWKSNDEIGMMVSEYNKMVHNLEQSKVDLARSQKESAWREIAKQVAHEIKNPLTPMKLTLQQMEYQLMLHKLDDEKARKSINTLLTQVDILNEIASSFSAFARMPAPILTKMDLVGLLKKSVDLYSDYEGGTVVFTSSIDSATVLGDEQLFNRIFSNIILNGLQSGKIHEVRVTVNLVLENSVYLITIRDNGSGIPPEMSDRIFLPYFSTKQSGSGLGLAISKQGIEQSGGEIWFESKPENGTTFFIKFPVIA
jgi:two-component system, NtrC family, nitrogen regulation sensor histidine kinase NtrY